MKYAVTFTQYHTYEVDATSENEARRCAYDEFLSDMRSPIASVIYDDVEVICEEEY